NLDTKLRGRTVPTDLRLLLDKQFRVAIAESAPEAGAHPRVVAERLGHATPSLVMNTYGHATERMQKDATAALESVLGA
ncbi:MAG TPA: hypothetical protein VK565_05110, partial [Gemmatimonadaceae bacterium]|nr:hypothetical protein [Gemmatimonadaceae bacterium]